MLITESQSVGVWPWFIKSQAAAVVLQSYCFTLLLVHVFSYTLPICNNYLKQWLDGKQEEGFSLPFHLTGSSIRGLPLDCSHLSFLCVYGIMSNGTFTLFSSLDYFGPLLLLPLAFLFQWHILSNVMRTTLTKSDAICRGLKVNIMVAGRSSSCGNGTTIELQE